MKVSIYGSLAVLLAVAICAVPAQAGTLIGSAVGSGNGEQDITSLTPIGLASDGVTDLPASTNSNGRGLIGSSDVGATLTHFEWQTSRISYPGNNPAFGWDGADRSPVGLSGGPANGGDPYIFVNSGVIGIQSAEFLANISSGDMITLSYELGSFNNSQARARLELGGGAEVINFTAATQVSASDGVVVGGTTGGGSKLVSETVAVSGNHTSGYLFIELDTLTGGNQTLIDNIVLSTTGPDATGRNLFIPEPTSLVLGCFAMMLGAVRRRS